MTYDGARACVTKDNNPEDAHYPWRVVCLHDDCDYVSPGWLDQYSAIAGALAHLREQHGLTEDMYLDGDGDYVIVPGDRRVFEREHSAHTDLPQVVTERRAPDEFYVVDYEKNEVVMSDTDQPPGPDASDSDRFAYAMDHPELVPGEVVIVTSREEYNAMREDGHPTVGEVVAPHTTVQDGYEDKSRVIEQDMREDPEHEALRTQEVEDAEQNLRDRGLLGDHRTGTGTATFDLGGE